MYTIVNFENEIIINKSKFITNIISVDNELDAKNKLNDIKLKYKDANHNTYAYIIDNIKRFSDDGEPNNTAGMPILNVLEKNNLNHVICIVTRYFGGIKLGANGLVRAYSNSCNECIKLTKKLKLDKGYQISISFNYSDEALINNIIKDSIIVEKKYTDNIIYILNIKEELLCVLNKYNLIIIKEIIIKSNS